MDQVILEKLYRHQMPLYAAAQSGLMSELESPQLLRYSGANIYRVTSRIKTFDSLTAKLARRNIAFDEQALNKIDDIVGARIVCLFQEDLQRIHHYLSCCGAFKLCGKPEAYIWDGMEWISIDEFSIERKSSGYGALHYIAQLSTDLVGENNLVGAIKFEIQARTLMQEAWAALEHSVGYKNNIPDRIRGYFDSAADLLGLIDRAFQRLKNESNRLQSEMDGKRLPDGEALNFYTLKQLAFEQFGVMLAGRAFTDLLKHLLDSPVQTIEEARARLASPIYREAIAEAYQTMVGRAPVAEDILLWLPLYDESLSRAELADLIGKGICQTIEYRHYNARKLLAQALRGLDHLTLAQTIELAAKVALVERTVSIEVHEAALIARLREEKDHLLYGCRQCFGPILQIHLNSSPLF